MVLSADDVRAAAQGRRIAAGMGHDVTHTALSGADWADYGRRASHALEKGNIVPHPISEPAPAPAPAAVPTPPRPAPAPRSSSGGGGGGSSFRVPSVDLSGDGTLTRLVTAVIAGLVILQLGSMLTGQYFNWGFGKGASPAAPPAAPVYKPLYSGQALPTAAAANAAHAVGAVAAGTGA